MFRVRKLLTLLAILLVFMLCMSSCDLLAKMGLDFDNEKETTQKVTEKAPEETKLPEIEAVPEDVAAVYKEAQALGYKGSLEEFLELCKGEKGDKGDKGDKGEQGEPGSQGAQGAPGADGVGVSSVYLNSENHLIILFTDGSEVDCGMITPAGCAHEWGESVIVVKPTCFEAGIEYHSCMICRVIELKELSPEHTLETVEGVDPTCYSWGYADYEYCIFCDYNTYVELPALEHIIEWSVITETTCLTDGQEGEKCTLCGEIWNVQTIPAPGHTFVDGYCSTCSAEEPVLKLFTAETTLLIDNGYVPPFYLFASFNDGETYLNQVILFDEAGNQIGYMYDDGQYSKNGDEFPGDGVYTLNHSLNAVVGEYTFVAIGYVNGTPVIESKPLVISIENAISDEQLDKMESVDATLEEGVMQDEKFEEIPVEEKKAIIEEKLEQLESQSLIIPGSIVYDEETKIFTFQYESGALGAVALVPWETENDLFSSAEQDWNVIENIDEIDAIILWSFGQAWDDPNYRMPYYENLETLWDSKGMETTVDWEVTVADYKNLTAYEIIMISGHGAYYNYKVGENEFQTIPGIILCEQATRAKDALYADDLKMHRIAKISVQGGTVYAILPAFWSYYYNEGDLDGSFVFSESCEFMGIDGSLDNSMADALLNASVESVVGFCNSVMADYSREFMQVYVSALINGYTSQEAFDLAVALCGANDYFEGRELYGPAAYPLLNGSDSILVNTDLENGSFEEAGGLGGWTSFGDVRVLSKIGELYPKHFYNMAILTTGVGSGNSDAGYSILSQTFKVSQGGILTFDYNVLSEEPMEYVGSTYDDKFYAEIINEYGNTVTIAQESVNKSKWYSVSGVNFDGGDSTCYQTGWKVASFDLSAYVGQTITIRFTVKDVGDSAYDTAAIIDNVTIQ